MFNIGTENCLNIYNNNTAITAILSTGPVVQDDGSVNLSLSAVPTQQDALQDDLDSIWGGMSAAPKSKRRKQVEELQEILHISPFQNFDPILFLLDRESLN